MTDPVSATSQDSSILQNYLNQQAQAAAAANAAKNANATPDNGLASTWGNFQTYLKILTTQLQHQDPSNATDPNQFTQELVQFAGVEQQIGTNTKLDTLINMQKASGGAAAALGYMGNYVEAPAGGFLAVQSGSAELGYNLTSSAQSAIITVKDAKGATVATLDGSTNQGLNYVTWDGKDPNGNQLADGTYTYTMAVTNTDGTPQTVNDVRMVGKVTGITSNSDGTVNLAIGNDIAVQSSNIDAVFSAGNLPAVTKSSTPSS